MGYRKADETVTNRFRLMQINKIRSPLSLYFHKESTTDTNIYQMHLNKQFRELYGAFKNLFLKKSQKDFNHVFPETAVSTLVAPSVDNIYPRGLESIVSVKTKKEIGKIT